MGEMITDVGIDLDGVIYPFAKAFSEYCCEQMGRLFLPEPTHWHFYEDWDLDEKTFNLWLRDAARTHRVFATEKPYEGVVEAWEELQRMGLKIHVMTARPQEAWAQTAEWLEEHGLHVDTLHFSPSKSFLSKIAKKKAIMIDDHVVYYEAAEKAGIIPFLMTRPWNSDKQDANRVTSLPDFASVIRGYNLMQKYETLRSEKLKSLAFKDQYVPDDSTNIYKKITKKSDHEQWGIR